MRFLRVIVKLIFPKIVIQGKSYRFSRLTINKLAASAATVSAREAWILEVFDLVFEYRSGAFIDVGANYGQTLLKKLTIDEKREYVGVEPQLYACAALNEFINDNRISRHTVLPIALSNQNGLATLRFSAQGDESASIASNFRPKNFHTSKAYVPCFTGDTLLESLNIEEVCLLKIDVEGAELDVIRGFSETIQRSHPPILFEVLSNFMKLKNMEVDDAIKQHRLVLFKQITTILKDADYKLFEVSIGDSVSFASVMEVLPDNSETKYMIAVHKGDSRIIECISSRIGQQ